MKTVIKNQTFQHERALYNLQNAEIINCHFDGPKDGESSLKESRNITIKDSYFNLRYPLWHTHHYEMIDSRLGDMARAAFWYSSHGLLKRVTIDTIKSFRNAEHISIKDSNIIASEFGWYCNDMHLHNTSLQGDYPLLNAENITIHNSKIDGKYSLQYMKHVKIVDSILNTKDAFWHSENVIVENCIINGAYLGWYGKNLTFINCEIKGTQPLCYTEGVKLINCKMIDADLAFEYSDVEADIIGHIDSIKNPKTGHIIADSIGQIITSDAIIPSETKIRMR